MDIIGGIAEEIGDVKLGVHMIGIISNWRLFFLEETRYDLSYMHVTKKAGPVGGNYRASHMKECFMLIELPWEILTCPSIYIAFGE